MDQAAGEVHKLAKKNKFLLLWLYFEFPDGTAHFIGDNAHATIRQESLFLRAGLH